MFHESALKIVSTTLKKLKYCKNESELFRRCFTDDVFTTFGKNIELYKGIRNYFQKNIKIFPGLFSILLYIFFLMERLHERIV